MGYQEDGERAGRARVYPETGNGNCVKASLSPYVKTLSEQSGRDQFPGAPPERPYQVRRMLRTSCISSSEAVIVRALAWNARCIWMSEMNSEAMSVVDDSIVFANIFPRPPLLG